MLPNSIGLWTYLILFLFIVISTIPVAYQLIKARVKKSGAVSTNLNG